MFFTRLREKRSYCSLALADSNQTRHINTANGSFEIEDSNVRLVGKKKEDQGKLRKRVEKDDIELHSQDLLIMRNTAKNLKLEVSKIIE